MEQIKQEGTSVPKIRHIALRATDVEAMANFFVNAVPGLAECSTTTTAQLREVLG